ncbi:MAG: homoserine dehydrogenase [Solirubrobacterales bacterium]
MAKIGLLGCGTVGGGVAKLLASNQDLLSKRIGEPISIKKVLERDRERVLAAGLPAEAIVSDFDEILNDDEIDIVVELIGGIEPARSFILAALNRGKNVVSANKDLIAISGKEIFDAAAASRVDFRFEASVGGGIPIVYPLKQSLAANRIKEVIGIVNGTTNYILTKMTEENLPFEQVLREAQELGYAEADPTSDVGGLDAARKLAILASIAFNSRVTFDNVYVEGITQITPLDIKYGRELGYVIKLLAIAKEENNKIQVRVHPAFLPKQHPLANVNGVYNAVFVRGDAVGDVMHFGRGAGEMPTASAVVGDIMEIVVDMKYQSTGRVSCTCYEEKPILPIQGSRAKYYIRLRVKDRPGVLASIAGVFGNQNVSLATVLQKTSGQADAQLILITHMVEEANLRDALTVFENMPSVIASIDNVIRLEGVEDNE